jgi:hypothetical protein
MQIAPLAFVLDPRVDNHRVRIRDVVRITHHSDEAYAGALAVVTAIRASAARRKVPSDLLEIAAAALPDTRVRDRLRELVVSQESPEEAARGRGASGYVVDAVPLALLVAATSIRDGMESALHRGSLARWRYRHDRVNCRPSDGCGWHRAASNPPEDCHRHAGGGKGRQPIHRADCGTHDAWLRCRCSRRAAASADPRPARLLRIPENVSRLSTVQSLCLGRSARPGNLSCFRSLSQRRTIRAPSPDQTRSRLSGGEHR